MKRPLPFILLSLLALCSCEDSMRDQSRLKPMEPSPFFVDQRSARSPVEGTIARGHLNDNEPFYSGRKDGDVSTIPLPIAQDILARGQQRFNIYCAPCHGADGYGRGIVVQRGFLTPPTYHSPEMRAHPDGYFFDVITHGKGAMYPFASRIAPADRWAIVSYLRALQLSQYAKVEVVPEAQRKTMEDRQ